MEAGPKSDVSKPWQPRRQPGGARLGLRPNEIGVGKLGGPVFDRCPRREAIGRQRRLTAIQRRRNAAFGGQRRSLRLRDAAFSYRPRQLQNLWGAFVLVGQKQRLQSQRWRQQCPFL